MGRANVYSGSHRGHLRNDKPAFDHHQADAAESKPCIGMRLRSFLAFALLLSLPSAVSAEVPKWLALLQAVEDLRSTQGSLPYGRELDVQMEAPVRESVTVLKLWLPTEVKF